MNKPCALRCLPLIASIWTICWLFPVGEVSAQLRIATYNTLDNPTDTTDDGRLTAIMGAIGTTPVNGITKRVDVLALQEQTISPPSTNTVGRTAAVLNALYGVSSYKPIVVGFGSDQLAFVYDESTVEALAMNDFDVGTRIGAWAQLRPVGYTSPEAVFNVYSVHLKASSGDTDKNIRESEAVNIRAHAAGLGDGANLIYMGDFNIGASTDADDAYDELMVAGVNQPVDPTGLVLWPNSSAAVSRQLTQSTRTSQLGDGGATSGIDDRFDLQFVTAPLMDGEGLSYIGPTVPGMSGLAHSHRAFGNDGTSYNIAITSPSTGRSQPANVLQALHDFSDHLPVVADYQVPAVLETSLGTNPLTLDLGEVFNLQLTVRNAANVVAAIGADELDYSIRAQDVDGALLNFSVSSQQDLALGGGNLHQILLDTSTPGMKSDVIEIASGSQGVQFLNCSQCVLAADHLEIPISYEVLAATLLYGDYNQNNVVDAADYNVWRDHLGAAFALANEDPSASPGFVDMDDYEVWMQNFGQTLPTGGASGVAGSNGAVPEPGAWMLLVVGACLLPRRVATLEAWTRRT